MILKKLLLFVLTIGLLGSLARSAEAVGFRKFCLNWEYSFTDQGLAEDYLLHESGTIFGTIDAAHAAGWVYLNSQLIWSGYLDTTGCTPFVSGNAGTFSVWLATTAYRSTDDVEVVVMDGSPDWETYGYNWQATHGAVPNGVTFIHNKALGGGASAADASAIWTRFLQLNDGRVTPSNRYSVSVLDNCPEIEGSACYDSADDLIYLGSDDQGNKAKRKFLVAHEIGHNLHHKLFGMPYRPYTDDGPEVSGPDYCRCEHIPDENLQNHCLQSREHSGAAQMEGFGHFNGADAFNSPTDSYAVFGYYKHVMVVPGTTYSPPTAWWAYQSTPYRWKDTHCADSGSKGTELDWMTFFYEVHNKTIDKLSFTDIKLVYLRACGNAPCDSSDELLWSSMDNAVKDVFGAFSDKAEYWTDMGADHGVD